jgi:hypothetical protein
MIKIDDSLINPTFIISVIPDHERQVIEVSLTDGRVLRVRSKYRSTLSDRLSEIETAIAAAMAPAS